MSSRRLFLSQNMATMEFRENLSLKKEFYRVKPCRGWKEGTAKLPHPPRHSKFRGSVGGNSVTMRVSSGAVYPGSLSVS
jgi:hypothetical protein